MSLAHLADIYSVDIYTLHIYSVDIYTHQSVIYQHTDCCFWVVGLSVTFHLICFYFDSFDLISFFIGYMYFLIFLQRIYIVLVIEKVYLQKRNKEGGLSMIGEEEEEFLKLQKAQTNKEKISLTKDICHSYNRQGIRK